MNCIRLHQCITQRSLSDGRLLHYQMVAGGIETGLKSGNLLLRLYVNCGCANDARKLFDTLRLKNIRTWAVLFGCYAHHQLWEDSVSLFWQMWYDVVLPNGPIFTNVFHACAQLLNLDIGKEVFSCMIKSGCKLNQNIASSLVSMYTKCGCLHDARSVFDEVPKKDVVLWSAMLAGYSYQGNPKEAISLFWQMQNNDCIDANEIVCVSILKTCAKTLSHNDGRKVHDYIVRNSFDRNLSVGNTLIHMYAKCGCLIEARRVFDNIEHPDCITWSAMVAGYGECGNCLESFKLFSEMEREGIYVCDITCLNVLKACQAVEYLDMARQLHTCIISRGMSLSGRLENALVDVFAKCGALNDACHVFQKLSIRNVVSWSSLIAGYSLHGFYEEALKLFKQMLEDGVQPNSTSFVVLLNGVAALQNENFGKCIHSIVSADGMESGLFVGSALICMYAKCGAVKDAQYAFDSMPCRNIVAWSSMVACYAQQGEPEPAIKLFWLMATEGMKPDEILFVTILQACTLWAMLEQGQHVYNYALDSGNARISSFLSSALVDMYTNCGCLADAHRVFERTKEQNVGLWNAMISGYSQYGFVLDAFKLISQMILGGTLPDRVTIVGLLSACSHAGMLDEGWEVFNSLSLNSVTLEQYACCVDLWGRVGCLEQAAALVREIPVHPDASVWLSLVGVCRLHSNVELAIVGVKSLLEIKPENSVVYVLLSNIVYEAVPL